MNKLNITAVSFLNTMPFIYGVDLLKQNNNFDLILIPPSNCAELAIKNIPDIVLVPVGSLSDISGYQMLDGYCLGTQNIVRSVLLLSDSPINLIENIFLDSQSRSSNLLVQILAKHFWKISPTYYSGKNFIKKYNSAKVSIGDKAFLQSKKFKYSYDLAEYWYKMTGLPFVFAVWLHKPKVDPDFLSDFKTKLQLGIENIDNVIEKYDLLNKFPTINTEEYLKQNMNYIFDEKKIEAMNLFLKMSREL